MQHKNIWGTQRGKAKIFRVIMKKTKDINIGL